MSADLIKPKEAAKMLDVSYETLLKFVHEGKIPPVRIFGTRNFKIDPADVRAFIEASKSGANGGTIETVERPTESDNVEEFSKSPAKRRVYGANWAEEVRRRAR